MFFYMDNIVFIFLVERLRMVKVIIIKLKKYYNLTGGKNL